MKKAILFLIAGIAVMLIVMSCAEPVEKPSEKESRKEAPVETSTKTGLEPFVGLEGKIDIAGGTAHIKVMEKAAELIMTSNPKIRITVAGGGSGVGIQKVGEGLVQIGNSGRAVKPAEQEKYNLDSYPFCIDGVAACIHPDNPVDELSSEQIQQIMAGKITNWKDVGGNDASINLYGRDEASGTREVFWKKALAKGDVSDKTNIVVSNGAMKTSVSQDENGIGYVGIGHLDETIKGVIIDGNEPTQENAMSGKYPIIRKLYMNTQQNVDDLTKTFIKYIMSEHCKELIEISGYIPL